MAMPRGIFGDRPVPNRGGIFDEESSDAYSRHDCWLQLTKNVARPNVSSPSFLFRL